MPELLITASATPNLAPKSSPTPAGNAGAARPQDKPAEAASDSQATGQTSQAAEAGHETSKESPAFATVLKKQMNKQETTEATEAAAQVAAVDPAIITTEAELSALLPFIEQLLPLLAKKSAEQAEAPADGATTLATTGIDPGTAMIAAPLITGNSKAGSETKPAVAADQNSSTHETGLIPLANDENTKPAAAAAGVAASTPNRVAAAAISADEGAIELPAGLTQKSDSDFSALVARASEQLGSAQHTPSNGTARSNAADTSLRMEAPVGHKDWSNELGNKLTWMATAQRQQADLVLNPPQLGRIEISLTVSGDQASAVFASPSASVRELLEDSLPRLREILSDAGINLGETHVSSESPNRFADPKNEHGRNASLRADLPNLPLGLDIAHAATLNNRGFTSGRGMVDIFA
jgi:flagellar hook-length control protein FliK